MNQSLARLGGSVTGLEPNANALQIARNHKSPTLQINYVNSSIEDFVENKENVGKFDVVTCLEVIEHVNEPQKFVNKLSKLVSDDGLLFVSTISQTLYAYWVSIIMAEYVINELPIGTHHHEKFITPEKMKVMLKNEGMECLEFRGFDLDLSRMEMYSKPSLDINYFVKARKSID